ncbi:hypothetical protein AB4371_17400, partial [Vibrio sp. 10N.261.51.A3]|uniref:hypothetical protein n=1 Tax=Vibrio sp. 10N.261.51.A3 TaxID=3229673 RepID=UPI00354B00E4
HARRTTKSPNNVNCLGFFYSIGHISQCASACKSTANYININSSHYFQKEKSHFRESKPDFNLTVKRLKRLA